MNAPGARTGTVQIAAKGSLDPIFENPMAAADAWPHAWASATTCTSSFAASPLPWIVTLEGSWYDTTKVGAKLWALYPIPKWLPAATSE